MYRPEPRSTGKWAAPAQQKPFQLLQLHLPSQFPLVQRGRCLLPRLSDPAVENPHCYICVLLRLDISTSFPFYAVCWGPQFKALIYVPHRPARRFVSTLSIITVPLDWLLLAIFCRLCKCHVYHICVPGPICHASSDSQPLSREPRVARKCPFRPRTKACASNDS